MILALKIKPNLHKTLLADTIYRDFLELQWSEPKKRKSNQQKYYNEHLENLENHSHEFLSDNSLLEIHSAHREDLPQNHRS